MKTKGSRISIKLDHKTYAKLWKLRKRTGVPISNIMRLAVALYAKPRPGRPPNHARKLRGSR
jgi:hypothetical protein